MDGLERSSQHRLLQRQHSATYEPFARPPVFQPTPFRQIGWSFGKCQETENTESEKGEKTLQHNLITSVPFRALDTSSLIRDGLLRLEALQRDIAPKSDWIKNGVNCGKAARVIIVITG